MKGLLSISPIAIALSLWAFFIPIWNVGASMGMGLLIIALAFNFYRTKSVPSLRNKKIFPFLLFLIAHLASVCLHFNQAELNELKTILPFCIAPLLFSDSLPIKTKEISIIWHALIAGVMISLTASIIYGLLQHPLPDPRKASFLISHIRLSLLASVLFYHTLASKQFNLLIPLILAVLSAFFVAITATISGMLFFFVGGFVYLLLTKRYYWLFLYAFIPLTLFIYMANSVFTLNSAVPSCQQNQSEKGEPYRVNHNLNLSENGYLTFSCYAPVELSESWKTKTGINLNSFDQRMQPLDQTLIRYLTSKGLSKDQNGVNALSEEDVSNVLNGNTNINETKWNALEKRIYQIRFEYLNFISGGNPAGHSIFQRYYLFAITKNILVENFLGGVGRTYSHQRFEEEYSRLGISHENMPKQPHNQFLSFWLNSGLVTLILFLVLLISLFRGLKGNSYVVGAAVFLTLFVTSCLTEDTLNTQPGVGISTLLILLFFYIHPIDQKA
jgi:hypothetical protein